MIGQTLAHYRITAAIGAGGMGEVYRATDTKLGRDVALKVLPEETASDPERVQRFQREARAVAALNHPGIVTIHSVEEEDGIHFLTMEIVEGQSLDRVIPEDGLESRRFYDLAIPLVEAVSAAHGRGITHRDLKPANVMVTDDGRVKVLDFGLAKLQAADESEGALSHVSTQMQTREGVIVGTVPYMSPEQLEGQRVDHRTDVFSLGIILFEMATGQRPFRGSSTAALMSAILRDEPPAPTSVRAGLPEELEAVIVRCLAKDPAARYQGAGEVKAALEGRPATDSRIETAVADPPETSPTGQADSGASRADAPWMAVLPFKTQGSDPDLAAFADGLGEDITTGLSRFSHLFVISRNSASRYAERSLDVRALGRELGARYVLEGTVRKAGSAVRASVQLLDAATGTHLWAETYDRDLAGAGIFEVQDDVTDRVVATVADPYGVLVRSMALAVRDRPLEELSGKELVLRFCAYWHQIRPDEHARLREALERRLEREPAQAEAWACLSRLYSNEHSFRLNPLPDSIERARKAAQRAVDIDPTSQASWEALAEASYFARDLGAFRNAAERAMALNPRNTSTMALMGVLISHGGEWDRGTEINRRAMELNPHHEGWYHFPRFFDHYRKGEFEEALESAKQLNMPGDFWVHAVTAAVCGRLGRREEARAALESLQSLLPGYRDELRPTLGLWILDAAFVEQVMEGVAEAEALVGSPAREATPAHAVTPSFQSEAPSIAVLPFANLSPDPENQYFSDGLSEEIINALTRLPGLRVIARTSSFRFRGEHDLKKVGEALGVRTLLEGSVRKAGQRLRITAQLIDVSDDSHIWSERFDRELDDVFVIQDEISAAIVEKLHLSLGAAQPEKRERANVEAFEALLEGRHHFSQFTPEAAGRALACLERALSLEPNYPDALVLNAFYHLMRAYMFVDPREALPETRSLAERALKLDPHHGEAQATVAVAAVMLDWDWATADRLFRRALELAPGSARVHELYGLCGLLGMRRLDEALTELDRAVELDPLSALYAGNRGRVLTCSRRFAEAEESCRRGLLLDPRQLLAQVELMYALTFQGRLEEAVDLGRRAIEAHGPTKAPLNALALSLALAGRRDEARQLLHTPASVYQSPLTGGLVHAVSGEMDPAFEQVGRAVDHHDPMLMYLDVHPMFDALRADPRYSELRRRVNLSGGGRP